MNQVSMLINGERTMARDGATFERRNPLDDTVASTAPAATSIGAAGARWAGSSSAPMGPSTRSSLRRSCVVDTKARVPVIAIGNEQHPDTPWEYPSRVLQ